MHRTSHILNAASNLLGISLVIITGLHLADQSARTYSDEVAWGGAVCFALSCILSYLAIRAEPQGARFEKWADGVFLAGLLLLMGAVITLGFSDFR